MNFKTKKTLPSPNYSKSIKTESRQGEHGRSMVEILGALAIIGVISISGIMGYNYSMNKYRANEILAGASKRMVILVSQLTSGVPRNLSEFDDSNVTAGGTFLSTIQEQGNEFGITITGVKGAVCENLIRSLGAKSALRAIRNTTDNTTNLEPGSCMEGDNSLVLIFDNGTTAAAEDTESSSYCTTNECDLDCNGRSCKILSSLSYADSAAACGGEQNMFTPKELGCAGIGSTCPYAPAGSYWLVGDVPEDQGGSANAYFVIAGRLGRWNRVLTRSALCK